MRSLFAIRMRNGWLAVALTLSWMLAGFPLSAAAQSQGTGTLLVIITAQNGAIRLPGAVLSVSSKDGRTIATQFSDEEGQYQFFSIKPGTYVVSASLSGFDDH